MPFSRIAEMKIREAMADGAFDDLPNAGQPLDLEDYFATPADLRMAHSILKSAGVVPAEVELFNEVASLEQRLRDTTGAARAAVEQAVANARLRLAIRLEGLRRDRKSRP